MLCYGDMTWNTDMIWWYNMICEQSRPKVRGPLRRKQSFFNSFFNCFFFVHTNFYYKNRIVYSNSIWWSIGIICSFGSNIVASGLNSRFKIILQHTCGPRTFGLDCTLRRNQPGFNFVFFVTTNINNNNRIVYNK